MLEEIIEIAHNAGNIILKYYETDFDIKTKKDNSPVTQADLEADRFIVESLKKLDSSIPIISEESGIPGYDIRKEWTSFWLVDPLDGTKEFINKNGEFTVNIALIDDGVPVLGVVYVPAHDLTYYASKSEGAWKKSGDKEKQQIYSKSANKDQALVVVQSRSHGSDALEEYLRDFNIKERVPAGSSMKFCLVAEGKADIYPRLGPTMEWDVAAGDCVYRYSARDGVHDSDLRYNKPTLKNEGFVIGF
jgi:3'(2'), 5'-bisphosphate nucleotidase